MNNNCLSIKGKISEGVPIQNEPQLGFTSLKEEERNTAATFSSWNHFFPFSSARAFVSFAHVHRGQTSEAVFFFISIRKIYS